MTESEIMQAFLASGQVVISLFSMFFAMISAYIAGLYFFLNQAPLALRLLAFALLSVGLVFLGAAAAIQQWLQQSLAIAWAKVPSPIFSIASLRDPLPLALPYGAPPSLGGIEFPSLFLARSSPPGRRGSNGSRKPAAGGHGQADVNETLRPQGLSSRPLRIGGCLLSVNRRTHGSRGPAGCTSHQG